MPIEYIFGLYGLEHKTINKALTDEPDLSIICVNVINNQCHKSLTSKIRYNSSKEVVIGKDDKSNHFYVKG